MRVDRPADLDGAAVLAVAAGEPIALAPELLAQVAARRVEVLATLAHGPEVYGVTTGMGALSDTRLSEEAQAGHSARLMLARAVGGPPYLGRVETRALIAVRLRTFLTGDAGVSADLCQHLVDLLALDPEPLGRLVPATGSGAAGEILPLAHAWGHLAGVGPLAGQRGIGSGVGGPRLGAKEGIALLSGVPIATALALLRSRDAQRLVDRIAAVAAGSVVVARVSRDPYDVATARGDEVLADVLARFADLTGVASTPPRHLQAPVSFRVIGPVLAHLTRESERLREVAERHLVMVTDSPAYLGSGDGARFVGGPGFHGLELAAAMDSLRSAALHAAAVGAARLHRMLDPGVTGLPAQLSADPGPQAGLTPVHKRAIAAVHELAGLPAATTMPIETSAGQEDVQTFALEAAARLTQALAAAELVLATELLAVHQARVLAPERVLGVGPEVLELLDRVADLLPAGAGDRPWGEDLESLRILLSEG